MANNMEVMDIDDIDCDYDKENAFCHSNMLPKGSCTEKGYEELDVSELNMKLRYSITPSSSPMSKSYTANCVDNKHESGNNSSNSTIVNENNNLTYSPNSTMTRSDTAIKSLKSLPLQALPQEQFVDGSGSVLRLMDTTAIVGHNDVTVTLNTPNDPDENLSIPSSLSSNTHTPEATTPTKEVSKQELGSPIIRGLKSVLNMFRPSQSPIPPLEENKLTDEAALSPPIVSSPARDNGNESRAQAVLASTPIAAKTRESSSKRNSPHKDSIVFNDDLERELQWKDETTVIFSHERIPLHKLFYQNKLPESPIRIEKNNNPEKIETLDCTVENLDISYNESLMKEKIYIESSKVTDGVLESDCEFVDCETTLPKNEFHEDNNENPTVINTDEQNFNAINNNNKQIATSANVIFANNVPEKLDITVESSKSTISIKTSDLTVEDLDNEKENVTSVLDSGISNEFNANTVPDEGSESDKTNVPSEQESKTKNLDVLSQSQLQLNVTTEISNKSSSTNINEWLEHKAEVENIPIPEESQSVNSNLEIEFNNKNVQENVKVVSTHPINNSNYTSVSDVEELCVNEIITQPADIPLPDEDDIEKDEISSFDNYMNDLGSNLDDNVQNDTIVDNKIEKLHEIPVERKEIINPFNDLLPIDMDKEKQSVLIIPTEVCKIESTAILLKTEEADSVLTDKKKLESVEVNIAVEEILHSTAEIKPLTNFDDVEQHADMYKDVCVSGGDILDNVNIQENRESRSISLPVYNNSTKSEDFNLPNNDLKLCANSLEDTPIIEMKSQCDFELVDSENIKIPVSSENNAILQNSQSLANPVTIISENLIAVNEPVEENKPELIEEIHESNCMTLNSEITLKEEAAVMTNIKQEDNDKKDHQHCFMPDESQHNECAKKNDNEIQIVEDITVSESNSPYISVIGELELPSENKLANNFEEIENPSSTKTVISVSPPRSPKIVARGNYNFNFAEIDDPFATKTKIRMSPPIDASLNDSLQLNDNMKSIKTTEQSKKEANKNRRKLQHERNEKPELHKKNLNETYDNISSISVDRSTVQLEPDINVSCKADNNSQQQLNDEVPIELTRKDNSKVTELKSEFAEITGNNMNLNEKCQTLLHEDNSDKPQLETNVDDTRNDESKKNKPLDDTSNGENKASVESNLIEQKNTSSSEQSVYHSAGTSDSEGIQSKSVFNLPEIDDTKFNPFVTKSKICLSPPPNLNANSFATRREVKSSPESSLTVSHSTEIQKENVAMFSNTELNQIAATTNNSPLCISRTLSENDPSQNMINPSTSNTKDEQEITVREVNTENEDTIEGPFLEAEDFYNIDKMADVDSEKVDMMQYNDCQTQENEENAEGGELFIDSETFDFLMNQNKSTEVVDSGKESLFLKFDPLFTKRVNSDGVVAALSKMQKRQSTPKKISRPIQQNMTLEKAPVGDFLTPNVNHLLNVHNITQENSEDLNVTVSKPMMVVTPAVNPFASPKNKSATPSRSNRLSMTFASPAIAVIDRLLSLSTNNSPVSHDTTSHIDREQLEADLALTQLRELLAEKETHVQTLRTESKELKDRLSTLEIHMKHLENEGIERLNKINELNECLAHKSNINKKMAAVVEEYERFIASLIAETEQDKKRHAEERMVLIKDRDEQSVHLASMEISFNDLHSKYEKSKQVIFGYKANEDAYKQLIKEFEDKLAKTQQTYDLLKQHATLKLNHANQEFEILNRAHDGEILKLNTTLKRKEMLITSLKETLAQKIKANEELSAICDELLNRVR